VLHDVPVAAHYQHVTACKHPVGVVHEEIEHHDGNGHHEEVVLEHDILQAKDDHQVGKRLEDHDLLETCSTTVLHREERNEEEGNSKYARRRVG